MHRTYFHFLSNQQTDRIKFKQIIVSDLITSKRAGILKQKDGTDFQSTKISNYFGLQFR